MLKRNGRAIRQHWSIENQVHWSLDVTFNEDNRLKVTTMTSVSSGKLASSRTQAEADSTSETKLQIVIQKLLKTVPRLD